MIAYVTTAGGQDLALFAMVADFSFAIVVSATSVRLQVEPMDITLQSHLLSLMRQRHPPKVMTKLHAMTFLGPNKWMTGKVLRSMP